MENVLPAVNPLITPIHTAWVSPSSTVKDVPDRPMTISSAEDSGYWVRSMA